MYHAERVQYGIRRGGILPPAPYDGYTAPYGDSPGASRMPRPTAIIPVPYGNCGRQNTAPTVDAGGASRMPRPTSSYAPTRPADIPYKTRMSLGERPKYFLKHLLKYPWSAKPVFAARS